MKYRFFFLFLASTLITTTSLSMANDASALYKKKCSGCHGANGEGKPAVKAPALKGTQLDASQIVQKLTKGTAESKPPHTRPCRG